MKERIFAIAGLADIGVLYLLIILSVVSIMMIVERFLALKPVTKSSRKLRESLKDAIHSRNLSVVEKIAEDTATIEGRAAAYALDHIQKSGTKGVEEVFSSIANLERPKLERSLGFLATVGANAPYIGLFGTVLGIMKAFQDLSNAASDAGQGTVMAGISGALIATAAGLMVAIPAVLAYNYFQKQVKTVMTSLDTVRDLVLAYGKAREQ